MGMMTAKGLGNGGDEGEPRGLVESNEDRPRKARGVGMILNLRQCIISKCYGRFTQSPPTLTVLPACPGILEFSATKCLKVHGRLPPVIESSSRLFRLGYVKPTKSPINKR